MSYASGTTHYNLPQTVGSDKRDWADTNQAFSDIDAAIYGAVQGASAATSAIETINGEIETITGKQAVDEGNISTLAGKVSTLESTVGTQGAAIADVRQDLQDNIESNHEASATSTHAYEIGDTFYYNDVLYKATAQIAIGGTIVPSTNCVAVTVMSEVDQINSDLMELGAEVNRGYVEVTPSGSETFGQILARLKNLVDFSKISVNTLLAYTTNNTAWIVLQCDYYDASQASFSRYNVGSTAIYGVNMLVSSGGSYTSNEGTTVVDQTNQTATTTIRLYY